MAKTLEFVVTPKRGEVEDRFGNVHRVGLMGVTRQMEPEDRELVRYNPIVAFGMGVRETWFIIDRTFLYLGRIIAGKEDTDQLGGPLRIAQVSGQVLHARFCAAYQPVRHSFGQYRTDQSIPHSDVGRGPSALLRLRGHSW